MGRRIAEEYRIITTGAGWLDRSSSGRLRFTGADAASFLHALVSNDVATLTEGQGVYTTHLTPQGRMVTDLTLYRRPSGIAAEIPSNLAAQLAARFDQLIFAEDVRVEDVTAETCVLRIVGHAAASVAAQVMGVAAADLATLPGLAQIGTDHAFAVRADIEVVQAFDLWMPIDRRAQTLESLSSAGVPALTSEFSESLRLAAARPAFGVDMTAETIPLEAGLLDRAISLTKGCYVGQEVIVRVLHRGGGRVARRLVQLTAGDDGPVALPPAGTSVQVEGHEPGRITSAAWSPDGTGFLALGYLPREAATIGTRAHIDLPSGPVAATVTRLAG